MSSSSQPEEIHLDNPGVDFADMDLMPPPETFDLDSLLFTPTLDITFSPEDLQTVSPFSLEDYDISGNASVDTQGAVSSGETTFQSLAYEDSTSHQLASAAVNTEQDGSLRLRFHTSSVSRGCASAEY
jgi:hypothetical protein